ncbi:MAG: tRNA pseudouridine(55) synthase TruB [Ferruginibacter sp.]|nr:tRNA pseudouridine(55) synthase TruB [Chitinophagaceae bacterium]MBP6285551.1 tRNA pseudouridine(55) synthase TruB [Ferruginibacter sp.]MBU9936734.1 tRNA pseudouridine(55) synthase TruB [Ferruginibacter sp.]
MPGPLLPGIISIGFSIFTFTKKSLARKQTYRVRYTNKLAEAGEAPVRPERKERVPLDPVIQQPYLEGKVLLINKPLHWTSFDVVRKLRSLLQIKKIGHAGTLDPLATGLLIVCTGKFTKKINEYMAQEKEYTGTFTLGAVTPTYDLESEPGQQKDFSFVTGEILRSATEKFTGETDQYPPIYSAIKKDGVALYELARRGEAVELKSRRIFIRSFEITLIELPVVHFKVVCSTGTYIRSLANDFGAELGCGAYLSSLCRTRIGEFRTEDAIDMDAFEQTLQPLNPSTFKLL